MPTTLEVEITDAGGYSIYHEYDGIGSVQVRDEPDVTVTDPSGLTWCSGRIGDGDLHMRGHNGVGVYTFRADEPGTYEVQASMPFSSSGRDLIAVGPGIGSGLAVAIASGTAVIGLSVIAGIVVAIVVGVTRGRRRRAAMPPPVVGWAPPGQWAPPAWPPGPAAPGSWSYPPPPPPPVPATAPPPPARAAARRASARRPTRRQPTRRPAIDSEPGGARAQALLCSAAFSSTEPPDAVEHLDGPARAVAPEQQPVGAAELGRLHHRAVGQGHPGAGRDVEAGLDHAVVAERDADAGVGADEAPLADADHLLASAGQRPHDRRAAADVRPVVDDTPALMRPSTMALPSGARVEVHVALVHHGRALGQVGAEPDAVGVGDAHPGRHHVVGHPRELVDAEHLHRRSRGPQRQPGALEPVGRARPRARPHHVVEHPEQAVEVDRRGRTSRCDSRCRRR